MARKLNDLIETIRIALCKLNRIQFDAPWKPSRGDC